MSFHVTAGQIGRGPRDTDPAPPHEARGQIIGRDGRLYTRLTFDELCEDRDRYARDRGTHYLTVAVARDTGLVQSPED